MSFKEFCESLAAKIQESYGQGITADQAEKLGGEFLFAQLVVSTELTKADLSARMRKTGVKAVRAALYLDVVQKSDKKPTEAQIAAMLDTNELVSGEQTALDEAEVARDELERYYSIFQQARAHFDNIAKGAFGG